MRISIFLSVLLLFSCKNYDPFSTTKQNFNAARFFPLVVGNYWDYGVIGSNDSVAVVRYRISEKIKINGQDWYKYIKQNDTDIFKYNCYRFDKEKLYRIWLESGNPQKLDLEGLAPYLDYSADEGETYIYNYLAFYQNEDGTYRKIIYHYNATVTSKDDHEIHIEYDAPYELDDEYRLVFTKDLGITRWIGYAWGPHLELLHFGQE